MTRKLLTLTLAALAFGATQAANINWETAVSATSSAGSSNQYIDVYAGAAATVAASITYGVSIGTGTVLSIGASLDNKTFSVQIGENGVYTLTAHGANGTPTITTVGSATAVANATQTVALSIVRGSNQSTTVILSVGGVEVAKIENHTISMGPIQWTEWGRRVGNQDAYSGDATYTATYYTGAVPYTVTVDVDQPGWGKYRGYSLDTIFSIFPDSSISRSFTAEVPRSTPI